MHVIIPLTRRNIITSNKKTKSLFKLLPFLWIFFSKWYKKIFFFFSIRFNLSYIALKTLKLFSFWPFSYFNSYFIDSIGLYYYEIRIVITSIINRTKKDLYINPYETSKFIDSQSGLFFIFRSYIFIPLSQRV